MKKNLLFAAMAVSALVSCSNDDVVDVNKGEGISFRASLDKALTRANVTNLQNLEEFNVTAIGNGAKYFTNLVVTSADNGANWTTASTYYWPAYELAFFAYSPQSLAGAVSIDNTAKKITGFSPAQAVTDQKDLVISYNTGTKTTNENTGVAMNFKHALSQIEVKAKCSNDKMKIEVLGVKLVNAAAKADFTFPEEYTGSGYALSQDKWSNWQDKDDHGKAYVIKGQAPVTLTADVQSIMFGDDNFMLIPQQLTKWDGTTATTGAYLSVLCRISTLDGDNETLLYPQPTSDNKDGKYAFSAVGIDTNWEPGKKYTYTLNFCGNGGGGGEIDPNPTDPTEPDNPNVDPTPIPDGNGGDPILGDPIKFTVTVDNWIDQPVDISM
ncbi:fimbrillin family protein [Bacteroides fragilis]|uniref:Fimbrillin family protein n=2 Tax=Bacteroides fragilis TaxID=817 RepID=A0AAP9NAM8_BACFG|nr:fimbrillin family protein [Bacteroides fragilis]EFR52600.1 hypothetical protein BFAG_01295 [Bacteroides fragilis 3_1_12]MBM6510956.1 fimbrillin family protein [Bacteroides fragilis]QKH84011.1 fimbrillin family protein [Bacteroides fragilis]